MPNNNRGTEDKNKVELANRIADQSKKVASTYQHIEDNILRVIRWFSSWIDKVLFNQRLGKIVALGLAILMYCVVNFNEENSILSSGMTNSKDLNGISITAKYNSDTFELSGLPTTANITITGEGSSVNTAANTKGYVVANLEGLTEGVHQVKLTTEGYGDKVNIKIDPSNVVVTLKKKTTRQFDLAYDFINQDKMSSVYSVGTPTFEYTKVNVRASKDTLDGIAFVKALIDVSNVEADFTQEATLVAYDSKGQPVNADIVPATVNVTVPVTSPNKTVSIEIETSGEVPNGMAIDSITMDQQTVTIYAPDSVLSKIDNVVVTLDVSTITKDSTILRPITLPTGVNSSEINQITMNVKLAEGVKKVIDGVNINYKNNVNGYKASQVNNITTTSVEVFGTQANIDTITADDITVYVDMTNAKPGVQEFQLEIEQPSSSFVTYSLTESTYTLNVLGETTTETESEGAGVE